MPFIPQHVTVVCLGNRCRSPAGEYLLRYYAKSLPNPKMQSIQFDSAGFLTNKSGMDEYTAQFLEQKKISTKNFVSKKLSTPYLARYDIIFVMERRLKDEILQDFFHHASEEESYKMSQKILSFGELVGFNEDIPDPYGWPWARYQKIMETIDDLAKRIMNLWNSFYTS
jgi:protein-tyrosine phosphatase